MVDVVVIGLGPVGATLANLLGRAGISVVVLEREPAVYPLPRAVHFDAECMRVFDAIGVAPALAEHCRVSPGMKFVNADGKLLVDWQRPEGIGPQGWNSSYRFHQPDLERILRERLATHACVDVRLRSEVFALDEHADHVQVRYEDLSCGALREVRARYVIGADGARSLVRRMIGSEMVDLGLHERWLVFDALLKRDWNVLGEHSVQFCDPARPATYVRGVDNRRRWEIMLRPGEDAARFAQAENVWSMLKKWITPDDADLERAVVYTFHAVIAQRWRQGRLMLAGDAAHQTPPFLGQGMCAGIRDASNLAWKLVAILRHGASDALLDTYQQERYPHVSEFITLAVELGRIIQAVDQDAAARRDEMFANGPRRLQSLSPRLGASALLPQEAEGGAISRQPTLADGRRMDDAAGNDFLLLTRGGAFSAAQCEAARAAFPWPLRWIEDASESTRQWLDTLDADAVLIRPDRYVAGVARGGDALRNLTASVGAALGVAEAPVAA